MSSSRERYGSLPVRSVREFDTYVLLVRTTSTYKKMIIASGDYYTFCRPTPLVRLLATAGPHEPHSAGCCVWMSHIRTSKAARDDSKLRIVRMAIRD